MQELEKILEEINEIEDEYTNEDHNIMFKLGAAGIAGDIKDIIRKHMNDGWIPVEEALPDEEAEEYIKKKLHGIGYLYPCLVTYRSPMTERIHVVRFYYDIYEH